MNENIPESTNNPFRGITPHKALYKFKQDYLSKLKYKKFKFTKDELESYIKEYVIYFIEFAMILAAPDIEIANLYKYKDWFLCVYEYCLNTKKELLEDESYYDYFIRLIKDFTKIIEKS